MLRAAGAGDELWRLLLRPRTAVILFNSVALASAVTLSTIAIAVPLAWLVVRSDLPLRRLWTGLLVVPLAVPSYVGGFVLIGALGPRGMLQRVLEPLGVERLPEIYGFPGAWLALTLFTYPYVFLVVRAALQGMDHTLEEASRSLGQSGWSTFWKITLPQLRPAIAAGGLLVALYTLSDFGAVSLLQFDSFTRVIYVHYQGSFDRHLAAGLGLVLVFMTLLILVLEHWSRGRAHYHSGAQSGLRSPRRISLGKWRLPALALCASVALFALVLPALTVGYWLLPQRCTHNELQRPAYTGVEYTVGFCRHRNRRSHTCRTGGVLDSKIPTPPYPPLRIRDISRLRFAGHCHRALTRLLRSERRAHHLSNLLPPDSRLSDPLPTASVWQRSDLAIAGASVSGRSLPQSRSLLARHNPRHYLALSARWSHCGRHSGLCYNAQRAPYYAIARAYRLQDSCHRDLDKYRRRVFRRGCPCDPSAFGRLAATNVAFCV